MKYWGCDSEDTERVLVFFNHTKALWVEDDPKVLICANETAFQKSHRRMIIPLVEMIVVY